MLSDQELAQYVESLVQHTAAQGGTGISADAVVRQLGAQLGVDLSPKAQLIRSVLVALLGPAAAPAPDPTGSRKDPFDPATAAAAGGPRAETPPQQMHFSTAAASSAPAPSPAVPHFFPQQHQHQMQYFLSAPQQYQHQQQQQRAGASPSPFDIPASYRYGHQPLPQADQAQLQRLVQLQHQQQQLAAAARVAAAAAPTPGESPRAPEPPPAPAPAASKKNSSASVGAKRKGGPGGLNKVCGVSPELQAIVGEPAMARTEIVKQLWAYIRRNNLQDPNNKRKIICNDELRLVFETDSTDMFQMNKLLSKHIRPLESKNDSKPEAKKLKPQGDEPISSVETDVNQLPLMVSDALATFFGTGEREMVHSEAVKRVWDHIKSNDLEDPENPTVILCDSKLKQLFGRESLTAHGVSELLSDHLYTQSTNI
ncbi:SWIB complex BAF60b domain-containing protein [Zea mays]|uniref:SWIB complex BAF60b domain-containing protein n=2 Tax=Zea mays TaxID=4577 RepID=A0A1D6QKL9_MAIZE|nr:SWIB complex BAF60b domain-containing protein [Zea mays]|eukprot:XP_023158163.1 mediator of RNA polymerase II transcription subunit 15 [Zea mays]